MVTDPSRVVTEGGRVGQIGIVPIRNLWLLMLYASDLFQSVGTARVELESDPEMLPDLLAEILAYAVEIRLRRQLTMQTQPRRAVVRRMRGRVDLLTTERKQLLQRAAIACRFEEFSVNSARNRLVRAALESIAGIVRSRSLAHRCRVSAQVMRSVGVVGGRPERSELARERFTRNDAQDRMMVDAARLALDLSLPSETAGNSLLPLANRADEWVRRLFERAIGGFYRVTLAEAGWKIATGRTMAWPISAQTKGISRVLPTMKSDIQLDHPVAARRVVIDTKFTSIYTSGWHREESLKSAYIYQMFSYLRSQAGCGDPLADAADGMLLHPEVGSTADELAVIQGHRIRFATVDLAGSATDIRSRLIDLLDYDSIATDSINSRTR